MRTVPSSVFTLAAAIAVSLPLPAAAETGSSTEFIGPPVTTAYGCPATVEWTPALVGQATGYTEAQVRATMASRYLSLDDFCRMPRHQLARAVKRSHEPKPDQPGEAASFRALQQSDESGTVKPDGLLNAMIAREALIGSPGNDADAGISSASWTALGPGNIGGRVRALSINPANPNDILIGSVSGGLWRTANAGASWAPINDFMANVAIGSIARDPSNPGVLYVGTGEGFYNIDQIKGFGIFKSLDGGASWSHIASTNPGTNINAAVFSFSYVNRIAIHPSNPNLILAATTGTFCNNGGLFRSTDGGASWTLVYARRALDVRFVPGTNAVVVGEGNHCAYNTASNNYPSSGGGVGYIADVTLAAAAVNGSLEDSANGSFSRTQLEAGQVGRVELAISPGVPGLVLAMNESSAAPCAGNATGKAHVSTNSGVTFALNSAPCHMSAQGWYDNALWAAPNDATRVIGGGLDLWTAVGAAGWYTTNTPLAWNRISTWFYSPASAHADHHGIVSDPGYNGTSNQKVYFANDGGIYRADNISAVNANQTANGWTNLNNGLAITQFYGGAGSAVSGRVVGGTQDNGSLMAPSSGTSWSTVFGGDGGFSAVDPVDPNYVYGEYVFASIHRSSNGGASAAYICTGIADGGGSCGGSSTANFIAPFILDPNNASRMLVGGRSLWRTNDVKAATPAWSAIKPSNGVSISAIAVAPGNPDIIWVGHNNGAVYCTINGTQAAPTWVQVSGSPSRMVMRLMVDATNSSRVFVTNGGYSSPNIHETPGGCVASPGWTSRHANLPAAPIRSVVHHPANSNYLYVGTEVGVFASINGGVSWSASNDGPGTVSVDELFWKGPLALVAVTHGRGMFQAAVADPSPTPGILAFTVATASASEGQPAQLAISRTGGSVGAVSVTVNTANGSATAPADYTALAGHVVNWAAGDATTKTVNIQTATDALVEGAETLTATLSSPTGGASIGAPSTATVSIFDPDAFPAGCVTPPGWTVPGTANAGWTGATDASFEGSCALKSLPVTDNQKAQIQFTGTFNAGNITFRRRVSSEARWDYFRFYIDGVEQNGGQACPVGSGAPAPCYDATATGPTASGTTDWNNPVAILSVPISAGPHTITFSYEKDSSLSVGSDAAWIDLLALPITPATFDLAVANAGTGGGVVTSSPPGINCPGTCTAPFTAGASVSLTATPNGGSTFASWSGAGCSGPGGCSVTMSAAQSVTATFNVAPASLARPADFDGNGTADISWKDSGGQTAMWLQSGFTTTAASVLLGAGSGWSVANVEGDFNGDGRADLLWVHTDGSTAVWLMNGTALIGNALLVGPGTGWTATHVADLNGDSRSDIVWKHSDGRVALWLMNGVAASASAIVLDPGTGFLVTHTGDFDGDGRADLLFRHTDGRIAMWLMNGVTINATSILLGAATPYAVTHVADLDGDGRKDLVFASTIDGSVAVWLMNGLSATNVGFILGGGSGWSVSHVGRFDAGASEDLLWKHTDGSVALWLMNGLGATATSLVFGGGSGWAVLNARDYNNDSRADLLWRHPATGMVALWTFNGTTVTGTALLFDGSGGWQPSP